MIFNILDHFQIDIHNTEWALPLGIYWDKECFCIGILCVELVFYKKFDFERDQ